MGVGGNVNNNKLKVVYKKVDNLKYTQNLLRDYWYNSSGKFVAKVAVIRNAYQIDVNKLNQLIVSSESHIDFGKCTACNELNLQPVKHRTQASRIYENEWNHHFCSVCIKKSRRFL